jgi:hypothetical protein
MELTFEATFDGQVFRPDKPINLEPNTKVKIVVEESKEKGKPYCFLDYAMSIDLDAPPDFSINLDDYLYGGKSSDDE